MNCNIRTTIAAETSVKATFRTWMLAGIDGDAPSSDELAAGDSSVSDMGSGQAHSMPAFLDSLLTMSQSADH